MICFESKKYEILPAETYKIIRNCSGCSQKSVYHTTNKFRVNANGKLLDVWLIYQCEKCKHTYNLPIYSRMDKDALDQAEYEALLKNNPNIVRQYGLDKNVFRKNGATIFNEPAYILRCTGNGTEKNVIQFSNPFKMKVRHDKLIAECLEISRTRAQSLLHSGALKISSLSNTEWTFASSPRDVIYFSF